VDYDSLIANGVPGLEGRPQLANLRDDSLNCH